MISWVTMRLPRKPHQTQSKNKSENRTGIDIEIEIGIRVGVSRNAICPTDSRRPSSKLGRIGRNQEARVVNTNIGIDRCLHVHGPDLHTRIALRSTDPSFAHARTPIVRPSGEASLRHARGLEVLLEDVFLDCAGEKGREIMSTCAQTDRQTHKCMNAQMHGCTDAR